MQGTTQYISLDDASVLVDSSIEGLLRAAATGTLPLSVKLEDLLAYKATRNNRELLSFPGGKQSEITAAVGATPGAEDPLGLVKGSWQKVDPFDHTWPDKMVEHYSVAYRTQVTVNGRPQIIVIGRTERKNAGMKDRARAVVFSQDPPRERALVEFSGNGNLQTATDYACPIKPRGGSSQLRAGEPIPEEYRDMKVGIFSSVVQGPYASNSVAVLADTTDLHTMLDIMARHGIIRGIYKGWM